MIKGIFLPLWVASFFALAGCTQKPDAGSGHAPKAIAMFKPEMPEWAYTAVLYECNVRQFSKKGDLASVTRQLPRLKETGFDLLWLMPIQPIGVKNRKGKLGSPYSIRDYTAIDPAYGSAADFKKLVDEAHALGMHVILDWVPNHTAWDARWVAEHPDFYTLLNGAMTPPLNERGEPTDWTDVADLNYDNPELRKAMIASMLYWIEKYDIDGFRVDMAGLVPNDFWQEACQALFARKKLFMLAEWQDEPEHFNSCFQVNYGWRWKDLTRSIYRNEAPASELNQLKDSLDVFYPENYQQIYFTQNHDENAHAGSEAELFGPAADAFTVLSFTWQGYPLVYNGQEDGLDRRLAFFERDPIDWKDFGRADALYAPLCALRKNNRALWTGPPEPPARWQKIDNDREESVYSFYRERAGDRVVVALNLGQDPQTFALFSENKILGPYADVFGNRTVQLTGEMQISLGPWEYIILSNK